MATEKVKTVTKVTSLNWQCEHSAYPCRLPETSVASCTAKKYKSEVAVFASSQLDYTM
jgi:hypothetical protein